MAPRTDESAPLLQDAPNTGTGTPPDEDTAFPYKQLGVLAICRIAEPIAFMSIAAYSFKMVQHIKGPDNASFYSGLLISVFALAEASAAMFWGWMSDRYGRKPIILVALAGTALSSLLFGFAKNYWVALGARVVGGFLNGNVAVMQTMVAEIVKRPEHEPRAYAMQPFMWSVGTMAGSSLGGFAAEPAKSYPNVFSPDGIFGKFPYLLPNLVAVVVMCTAMLIAMLFLEETNAAVIARRAGKPTPPTAENVENTVSFRRASQADPTKLDSGRRRSSIAYLAASAPVSVQRGFDVRRGSTASVTSAKFWSSNTITVEHDEVLDDARGGSTTEVRAFTKPVILCIAAVFLMCYHQMAFGTLLTVYLLDAPRKMRSQLDLIGGLGKTLPQEGAILATNSIIEVVIQGFIFPPYVERVGVWRSALICCIIAPAVLALVPFVSALPNPTVGIYILMIIQDFCVIVLYPCLLILLKNAVSSPQVLGKVNGLAMALGSGARTVAPVLVGLIYNLGSAVAWWSVALAAIIAGVEYLFIERPKKNEEEILQKASMEITA